MSNTESPDLDELGHDRGPRHSSSLIEETLSLIVNLFDRLYQLVVYLQAMLLPTRHTKMPIYIFRSMQRW
jgi:hypothetical protein